MRYFFLFILTFTLSNVIYSQQRLDISAGPSFPLGDFKNSDINNAKAAAASVGERLDISYTRKFSNHWGFVIKAYEQRNALNINSLSSQYDQVDYSNVVIYGSPYSSPPPPLQPHAPLNNWKFNKNAWWTSGLLIGLEGRTSLNNKLDFFAQIMAGPAFVLAPTVSGSASDDSTQAAYNRKGANGFGLNYEFKSGFIYNTGKRFNLIASIIYTGTNNIKFNNVITTFYYSHFNSFTLPYYYEYSTKRAEYQTLSSLQLTLGISFSITGKK
jgi:hypothetical protein